MTRETRRFTQADYARLPEGFPVELIDGQLVKEPSPTYGHQRILGQIHVELYRFVGAGRVVVSPIDLFVDEPMCQVHSLPANCPAHEPS
ncbi:MAG: hypothetical protein ACYTDY_02170 [Planctomycetota bacterium]